MKKAFLISASVLALSAGAAFAQSTTSDLYQNGSSNAASINQANDGSASVYSYVHQGEAAYGNPAYNSSANVTQVGNNAGTTNSWVIQNDGFQSATVSQTNSVGGTQNSGITQSNYGNNANVTQVTANSADNQYSSVTQSGQYGTVTVQQYGPRDNSQVTQTGYGSNPSWSGNSTAYQYVAGGVNIYQTGFSTNTSYATQNSDYSGVAVTQNGSGGTNLSNVIQNAGGSGNFASVNQAAAAGLTNTSTIQQSGVGGNIAGVYQH